MNIFLFLISTFNFEPSLNFTQSLDISWDRKLITYYKLKDGVVVDVDIQSFSSFQDYLTQLTLKYYYTREFAGSPTTSSGQGLVPDIKLPIKFPAPIAGIIGQGGNLDVSGSQRIDFGGSRLKNFDLKSKESSEKESWFPTPEMEQQLKVNLKGTIGEKINVFIDHDSERDLDLDNTIKLEYKGNEDEIVQSIKAGNTELSLPGIVLIGGATSHKGLFGLKCESKIGPVNITTILSREEAENQSKDWKGGGITEREIIIEDRDFVKARFFLLVPPEYVRSLANPHNIYSGDLSLLPKKVNDFHLYLDEVGRGSDDKPGKAFDIPNEYWQDSVDTEPGRFIEKLESEFFYLNTTGIDSTKKFTILGLNYSLSDEDLLAVRWSGIDWNGNTITIGESETDSLKNLQIIKRVRTGGATDTSYVSWWYELKNIYSIGGADISKINIKVFKHNDGSGEDFEFPPDTNITYRELLGLYTSKGERVEGILDTIRGIIQIPFAYPFLMSSLDMEPDSVYHKPKFLPVDKAKYYIWVQYEGIKAEYSLNCLNIIPESEKVTIEGIKMIKGKDYTIDYEWGTIKFLTSDAEDPNAKINVKFQYVPIIQPTAKNLIGVRAESKIGELGQVSSAFLYYSTSSNDFRPRLGREPRKIMLGEIVTNITTSPEFLTRLVDNLPLIDTDVPSSFSIQGNAGFSIPNPNRRGEIYLDDMEGAKSTTSLGLLRRNWHYGSVPQGKQVDEFAQIQWYNPRNGTPAYEFYPNLPEHKRNEKRTVLKLTLPSDDDWRYPSAGATSYWTSLLAGVSTRGMDFSENEFLEVWIRGNKGILHIDVGTNISEDHIRRDGRGNVHPPNDILDTEDKDDNDELAKSEDTGLDGIFDTTEVYDTTKTSPYDDRNDFYQYDGTNNPNDYSRINGTECNGIIDEEDLDRDGFLDRESDYFSFEIDLANDEATIEHNNGWKLFRIPINDYDDEKGTSQWECIKYARLWINGLSKGDEIEIAALDIVGNKWKHNGSDSVKISVKNTDENPDEYTPPPEIELEKDPYGRTEREQSLVLNYNSLLNEDGGCYTIYTMAKNFIQYKSLNIWVKGTGGAKFFIRIGGSESNYYEYRCDIPKFWKEVGIDLEEVARLKFQKSYMDTGVFVSGDYRIYGSPSFTNVGRIEFGVINEDSVSVVSGEVWIDELRLTDVRRKSGIAGNISTSVKFADFADFSLTYKANDPYFKSLGTFMSSQTSLATNSNHSLRLHTNLSLSKFLPNSWGMSIPLDLGLTRTKSIPKYQTSSDIILTESQLAHQSSRGLDRDCSINFSKSGSKNPLLKYTIDNIRGRVGYGDNSSFAYTKIDSSQSCYGSLEYGISPPFPPIKIKGLEFRYYPQQINLSSDYSYSLASSYLMTSVVDTVFHDTIADTVNISVDTSYKCTNPAPAVRGLSKKGGFSYIPINPLKFNYSMSITNDLSIEGDSTRFDKEKSNFDTETGRAENVSIGFSPSFGFISPSVDYSTAYGEDHRKMLISLREVNNSNNLSFGLPIDLDKTLGFFTRIRDETLDSTASIGTPHWVLMMMEKLFQKFHMPRLSHSISRSSRFYKVIDRPSCKYRWGISNEPVQWFSDYRNSFSITKSYGVSNVGIEIGNVSLSGGATRSISKSAGMGSSKGLYSENTEFPKLYLRISGLEKLAFLRNWFTSVTTSYDYTIGWKNSAYAGEDFHTLGRNTYYGFGLQPQWKQGISTGFSAKFSNGRDEIRGDSPSTLSEKSANYSLQGSYTFSAPTGIKVPFLSHIKWTGNLDVSLTTTYSTNFEENITKDKPLIDSKSLSITPQSSYNFSQSIRGGLNASYTRNWSHIGTGNTRNVKLTFFAEFSF